jgi:hypothetical protein
MAAVFGLGAMVVLYGQIAGAAESYDNPTNGTAPCVVLSHYDARALGRQPVYRAQATIENICGRSMDVRFCFRYAVATDDGDQRCFQGTLRPGASTAVEVARSQTRLAGPEFQWRYLP